MSQPIREENDDAMVTKMRLDNVIRGIKVLVSVAILIPSPAVEEATSPARNPHHMASPSKYVTSFLHQHYSDGNYELPEYSKEEYNVM